jgi:hypothetical protein
MQGIPTPQNIVSITYQLLQQVTDRLSVRGQLPVLTIQFEGNTGITRTKVVGFNEMLPYLRYLKVKADSLGKTIICNPPSTYDKKVVLKIGDISEEYVNGNYVVTNQAINPVRVTAIGVIPGVFSPYAGYSNGIPLARGEAARGKVEPGSGIGLVTVVNDGEENVDIQVLSFGTILYSAVENCVPGLNVIEIPFNVADGESLFVLVQSPPGTLPPESKLTFVATDPLADLLTVDNTGAWYTAAGGQFPVEADGNSPVETVHIAKATPVFGTAQTGATSAELQVRMTGTSFGILLTNVNPITGAWAFPATPILLTDNVVITLLTL